MELNKFFLNILCLYSWLLVSVFGEYKFAPHTYCFCIWYSFMAIWTWLITTKISFNFLLLLLLHGTYREVFCILLRARFVAGAFSSTVGLRASVLWSEKKKTDLWESSRMHPYLPIGYRACNVYVHYVWGIPGT